MRSWKLDGVLGSEERGVGNWVGATPCACPVQFPAFAGLSLHRQGDMPTSWGLLELLEEKGDKVHGVSTGS